MGNPQTGEAMRSRERLKREILATMIADIRKKTSETGSKNYMALADSMFPDVPESVRIEAWMALDDDDEEAWWRNLERTIDAEIVRHAIQKGGGKRRQDDCTQQRIEPSRIPLDDDFPF